MSSEIVACPRCGKHINFSIVELTVDQEVAFVQEEQIDHDGDWSVHKTECPKGHSFWFAAEEIDPLSV